MLIKMLVTNWMLFYKLPFFTSYHVYNYANINVNVWLVRDDWIISSVCRAAAAERTTSRCQFRVKSINTDDVKLFTG